MLLELKGISKEYALDKDRKFEALKNVNLCFGSSGLTCIKGASGSGKSTLLNLIALLDKPTNGEILFNGENILKYKEKKCNYYRNKEIGILFQSYNLIEDETVLYNIMLPALIGGQKEKNAEKDAIELLEKIDFPKEYYKKKVSLLSGGEKQRVALLRSLINAPYILLCDEPTGALDSNNSRMIMETLKKISHRRLVILVSHNDDLINEFADRIISIKDGQIIDDTIIDNEENGTPVQEHKIYKKGSISNRFTRKNLIKRFKRNLFSLFAVSISLTFLFLVFGFSYNANNSLLNASLNQFDIGSSTLSKETKNNISGSSLSISQVSRINDSELKGLKNKYPNFIYMNNYSYFVPSSIPISIQGREISNLTYYPVYSFSKPFVSDQLLIGGRLPKNNSLNEVVINQSAYELLKNEHHIEPLNKTINIIMTLDNNFYSETGQLIVDSITYKNTSRIVGVVKELSFLLTPKVYYSYSALDNYFSSYVLNNLSTYFDYEYTVKDLVSDASSNDPISSYSHYLFLKDINDYQHIKEINDNLDSSFSFTNNSYEKYTALSEFSNAISLGLSIFLVIAVIGSILILGIINYSSYIQDLKDSAILTSLGCNKDEITNIFINESLTISVISFALSIIFSLVFAKLINFIVGIYTDFKDLINIPFLEFNGYKLIIPLVVFLAIVAISFLTTYLPITYSKRISIKKELSTND